MADKPIGVLLPARLETRFLPPEAPGQPWRVKIVVLPDEPSMDRHNPAVTQSRQDPAHFPELVCLEAAYRTCGGNLAGPVGREAFRTLAGQVGAARAWWLARRFPPVAGLDDPILGEAEQIIDWAAATTHVRAGDASDLSRVAGLPDTIEIWLGRQTEDGVRLEKLEPSLTIRPEALTFGGDFRLFAEGRRWTEEAGLEGILALPFTDEAALESIVCLIAVGLGDASPASLFQDHRDSGALSLLGLGQPTNTIAGEPAVDLAQDPDTWWRLLGGGGETDTLADLALALTGRRDALDPVPGGTGSHRLLNRSLVRALWPALWGHTLRDIWFVDGVLGPGSTPELGLWASQYLVPEGPLPPIRVGRQPYGVLPVTSLRRWRAAAGDPAVESAMRGVLMRRRALWARGAERAVDHRAGASTDQLVDRLARTPTSSQYGYRRFAPLQALYALMAAAGALLEPSDLQALWEDQVGQRLGEVLEAFPFRRYATYGEPQPILLPLVEPAPQSDEEVAVLDQGGSVFFDWLEFLFRIAFDDEDLGVSILILAAEFRRPFPPNSLLLRLLIYAAAVAHGDLIRAIDGQEGPLVEPFAQDESQLGALLMRSIDGRRLTFRAVLNAEGSVGAVADSPAHAVCALLIKTLERLIVRYQQALAKGPEAVGRLLVDVERAFRATLDTALMRDDPWLTGLAWRRLGKLREQGATDGLGVYGWVDHPYHGEPGPTTGGLLHAPSEAQLRAAVILRDRASNDATPTRWQVDLDSRRVRLAAQLAAQVRGGSPIQEVLGRAVEQIVGDPALVRRLREEEALWMRREHAGRRVIDGQKALAREAAFFQALGIPPETVAAIQELKAVVDAYADLLVADAVYHVVNGRPEKAGETMEAAAGLALPPELEVLRTPRRGRALNTSVYLVLPRVVQPVDTSPGASPAALADATVAAFLAERLPAATWRWQLTNGSTLSLDDLGLAVAETLAYSPDGLLRLVESIGGGAVDAGASSGMEQHGRLKRLALLLAGHGLQAQVPELRGRYGRLREAGDRLLATLQAPDAAEVALAAARRWGIAPPDAGQEPAERLRAAADTLAARLAAAPETATLSDETPIHQIATALAELAAPGGALPIFGRLTRAALNDLLPRYDAPALARFTRLERQADLDRRWLEIVAPVRPNLARLESFQLESGADGFAAWANQDDPWAPQPTEGPVARPSNLVVVYGPEDALPAAGADPVALAVLDAWGETAPAVAHSTAAAFGFNAPGARAPQAVLVAVTPDEARALDGETLAQIVWETREMAHARMALPGDVEQVAGIFPFTMLPIQRPTGVRLDEVRE